MSHQINLQDALGILAQVPGFGITHAIASAVPADGGQGFAPGCQLEYTGFGTGQNSFYWNTGTFASCAFRPLNDSLVRVVVANMPLNANNVDQAIFTADRAYQVVSVTEIHATLGTDGSAVNVQLTKDTGTNAPGAGTDLLTNNTGAGFDLKATINTLQTGALTATLASLQLAAGDRLSLDYAGTITALAGVQVTVYLKPI